MRVCRVSSRSFHRRCAVQIWKLCKSYDEARAGRPIGIYSSPRCLFSPAGLFFDVRGTFRCRLSRFPFSVSRSGTFMRMNVSQFLFVREHYFQLDVGLLLPYSFHSFADFFLTTFHSPFLSFSRSERYLFS